MSCAPLEAFASAPFRCLVGLSVLRFRLGCEISFAQKYSKEEAVTFAMYGDGAANQGQLFEALNISALWDLPSILVCENNHYGMGTAEWRDAKSPSYYKRGDYVPGLKVCFEFSFVTTKTVQLVKIESLTLDVCNKVFRVFNSFDL